MHKTPLNIYIINNLHILSDFIRSRKVGNYDITTQKGHVPLQGYALCY